MGEQATLPGFDVGDAHRPQQPAVPDGWLFQVCVRACAPHDCGLGGGGRIVVFEGRESPPCRSRCLHALPVFVSRAAVDAICERLDAVPIGSLVLESGTAFDDDALAAPAELMRPVHAATGRGESIYAAHLRDAFAAHVAIVYGGVVADSHARRGGLANWQLRRAQELMLAPARRTDPAAGGCRNVSPVRESFLPCVPASTGRAPYSWLLEQRVEAAKALLRAPAKSLSEVAAACGFSDQSHFTRVFQRHVGASPGAWRRLVIRAVQ